MPSNATEIVRFLKAYKSWVFFLKTRCFFELKLQLFQTRQNAYQILTFLSNVFSTLNVKILQKTNQRLFTIGKIRKFMKSNIWKKLKFSSFQKASSTKLERWKYAGGRRPSCLHSTANLPLLIFDYDERLNFFSKKIQLQKTPIFVHFKET